MENKFLILDNGSGFCKAGFSGEPEPKVISPFVVGRSRDSSVAIKEDPKDLLFGQEALDHEKDYELIRPIKKGLIDDWDYMELYWDNLFKNELKVDPSEHGVLVIETPLTPLSHREKLIKLLFEHFKVPSLIINNSATLTFYAINTFSGVIIDSGYDHTMFVPVRNGFPFVNKTHQLDIGGEDISEYLQFLLKKKGIENVPNIDKIKEDYCFVSDCEEPDKEKVEEVSVELPDKTILKLKEERYRATELFYHPERIRKELGGIGRKLFNTLYDIDHYLKRELRGPIVLAGGNTLFKGFEERLTLETKYHDINSFFKNRIKMHATQDRQYIQWLGGSIFSLISVFPNLCTTKAEFDECGPSAVSDRCFYNTK